MSAVLSRPCSSRFGLKSSPHNPSYLHMCVMGIQGTKVLESQEIRATMQVVREGAPDMRALARIVKYDGNLRDPQWVDVDQGTTFDSTPWSLSPTFTIQKRGLGLCAM